MPGENKSACVVVYLPAQIERASGAGKASRADSYECCFGVVEYARRSRWRQLSSERARDTVTVSPCKLIASDIAEVTDIQHELRGPTETSQMGGNSPVDSVDKNVALVHRRSRGNGSRDCAAER